MELPFEDVPFEILEVLVSYLNTKYYYEQMKEIKPSYNEPYPIPENLSLDVNTFFNIVYIDCKEVSIINNLYKINYDITLISFSIHSIPYKTSLFDEMSSKSTSITL